MSLSIQDRKKAFEIFKTNIKKQFGNESIVDINNLPPVDVIPFGSYKLDHTSCIGGLVRGRLTQIYGDTGTGKSTLMVLLAISAQQTYTEERILIVDAEQALSFDYAEKLGLNTSDAALTIIQPQSANEGLGIYLKAIESGLFSLVILDSVPALIPERDLEAEVGERQVGTLASLMSSEIRKVINAAKKTNTAALLINQIRAGIGFTSPEKVIPGGNALKFYPSVNIELKRKDLIKKGDDYIGQVVQANFIKNRFGHPYRKTEYKLYYGEGIRKSEEVVEVAKDLGLISRSGAWYTFPISETETERTQGMDNVINYYTSNINAFNYIESLVKDSFKVKREATVGSIEEFIEEE